MNDENTETKNETEDPNFIANLVMNLPVPLTPADEVELSRNKRAREKELEEIEEELDAAKARLSLRIKEKKAEIEKLNGEIDAGARTVPVACFRRFVTAENGAKMTEVVRRDTGWVVGGTTQAASMGELQRKFPELTSSPSGKPASVLGDLDPAELLGEAEATASGDADEEGAEHSRGKRGRKRKG